MAVATLYDYEAVRISGHYVEVDGPALKDHYYAIRKFDFIEIEGKEKEMA